MLLESAKTRVWHLRNAIPLHILEGHWRERCVQEAGRGATTGPPPKKPRALGREHLVKRRGRGRRDEGKRTYHEEKERENPVACGPGMEGRHRSRPHTILGGGMRTDQQQQQRETFSRQDHRGMEGGLKNDLKAAVKSRVFFLAGKIRSDQRANHPVTARSATYAS